MMATVTWYWQWLGIQHATLLHLEGSAKTA